MVSQLDAGYLDDNTTLVTLSIGGNDMRFAPILARCIQAFYFGTPENPLTADCSESVLSEDGLGIVDASAYRLANELPDSLRTVLAEIRARAKYARIALVGYPKLFESGTTCVSINSVNQSWLNDLADDLNTVMADAAADANHAGDPAVFYVDPQPDFSGKNLCTGAGVSAINGIELVPTPGEDPILPFLLVNGTGASQTTIHPNQIGTTLYALALEAAIAANP